MFKKYILPGLIVGVVLSVYFGYQVYALSVYLPYQGGTGTSTASVADIGKSLVVSSVNPLVYAFATGASSSSTLLSDFNTWSGQNTFLATTTFTTTTAASSTVRNLNSTTGFISALTVGTCSGCGDGTTSSTLLVDFNNWSNRQNFLGGFISSAPSSRPKGRSLSPPA
jgi:hypothetical protein